MKSSSKVLILLALLALGAWMAKTVLTDTQPAAGTEQDRSGAAAPVIQPSPQANSVPSAVQRVSIEDTKESKPEEAPPATLPGLRFEILGVDPGDFHGVATLSRKQGGADKMKIDGPQIAMPLTADLRKIRFAIDGYCIAECFGPFKASDTPIPVPLKRACEMSVRVLDTTGTLLAHRLVYCFPDKETKSPTTVGYVTTRWAVTDDVGRARIQHVLPGSYRISTSPVAEWSGADLSAVQVSTGASTSCDLTVPVLGPHKFGGFTIAKAHTQPLSFTPSGTVRRYKFWTEDGRQFRLYRIGDEVRCAVRGKVGQVIRGRIQWRDSSGSLHAPSKESSWITVTVGAVPPVTPTWSNPAQRP